MVKEYSERSDLLQERLDELASSEGIAASAMGQTTMGHELPQSFLDKASGLAKETVGHVARLVDWNCRRLATLSTDNLIAATEHDDDPLTALLAFVTHATPDEQLAQSISASPREFLENMSLTFAHHLTSEHAPASHVFEVDGVPDTTDKVKGRLAWMQVPKEGGNGEMGLELVWKVRFFMFSWEQY